MVYGVHSIRNIMKTVITHSIEAAGPDVDGLWGSCRLSNERHTGTKDIAPSNLQVMLYHRSRVGHFLKPDARLGFPAVESAPDHVLLFRSCNSMEQ